MFEIINLIEPWMFLVAAILLVAAGVIIGEVTILPWLSFAIFFVGIADFLDLSVQSQLIVFCVVFFASVYLSHRYISLEGRQPLIAEVITDMVGQKVTVTRLEANKPDVGSALSQNGKAWNVRHAQNEMLRIDRRYTCTAVSGITLMVSELETPEDT
jgi:membrane protein implicated in regulation of membrane protease activity